MRDADGPGSSIPTAARLEAENYQQVAALGAMKTEILETTRALGDMKNFMRANFTMTDFKKDFQRAAWDSIDNPFDSGILFSLLGPAGLGPAAVKQATRGQR